MNTIKASLISIVFSIQAWSYCQAAGFVAKRKTNKLEKSKKEESAGKQRNLNKNKWNVLRMY